MSNEPLPLRAGRWTILMRDAEGGWVRIDSFRPENRDRAIRSYRSQPRGYEYRLYDPAGKCVTSCGFH